MINNKNEVRKEILKIREELSKEEKDLKDSLILDKLFESDLYKNSKNIFVYVSFRSEINTFKIIEKAFTDKKEVYVPKVFSDKTMQAIKIDSLEKLEKNKMGILEPKDESLTIDKTNIDLIIVPGAVFDENFSRIGYGGGYYDRFLKEIKNKKNKVALAYDFQVLDKVITEEYDIKVDIIITEKRILI